MNCQLTSRCYTVTLLLLLPHTSAFWRCNATQSRRRRHLRAGYAMFKIGRTQSKRKPHNLRREAQVSILVGLPFSARCGFSILWRKVFNYRCKWTRGCCESTSARPCGASWRGGRAARYSPLSAQASSVKNVYLVSCRSRFLSRLHIYSCDLFIHIFC